MVDRKARDGFAQAIRALVAGTITNDQFEDSRLPALRSADPAVKAIQNEGVWHLYSDLEEHRLRGKHALARADKTHVARWVLFLKTDLPYEWPVMSGLNAFLLALASLLTLGAAHRCYAHRLQQHGDMHVWPFIRQADYQAALARPVYLRGRSMASETA